MASSLAQLLRTVRTRFGLSQEQLAPWLGVSGRLISYAEKGARKLPANALAQLTRLATLLPADPAAPVDEPAFAEAVDLAPLHTRVADCRYEALTIRRELARQAERAAEYFLQLAAVAALLPSAANDGERLWLELRQLEATRGQRASGSTKQVLLRARLAALEAEVAWLAQHLPT